MELSCNSNKLKWESYLIPIPKLDEADDRDDYVEGDMAFRLGIVWELTKDVMSFQRGFDAESGLQRNVVSLVRQ
ncbi:hypothetical protein [Desulfonema magnum]|uniref:Uncharacterized protein n=1 Tax=Desulfonema magnum TaxID=45655 RepID=A0A975BMB5_9BACT|nr:hypothetical protein [Desulfonema magnum]QTA87872.1 Uncharacterized protein dnm_039120 [Desulfonema magnum]